MGAAGLSLATPISVAIAALLAVVALSYFQTIHGYPSGGGLTWWRAKNLGLLPGTVAASRRLPIDYALTAAVSLTAAVEAIASAFPALWAYRVRLP